MATIYLKFKTRGQFNWQLNSESILCLYVPNGLKQNVFLRYMTVHTALHIDVTRNCSSNYQSRANEDHLRKAFLVLLVHNSYTAVTSIYQKQWRAYNWAERGLTKFPHKFWFLRMRANNVAVWILRFDHANTVPSTSNISPIWYTFF